MISRLREIEDAYTELFCEKQSFSGRDIFSDSTIPGMYCHNFVLFQDVANQEGIRAYISDCLQEMNSEGKDFLKFVFHPNLKVPPELLEWAEKLGFEVSYIKYMSMLVPPDIVPVEKNGCVVRRAETADEIDMGLECAAKYRPSSITAAKLKQKREAYLNKSLLFYICYVNGSPVGFCDWFEKEDIVKFEEFVILEEHKGKGYGTRILRKMLADAVAEGKKYAYVVTDAQGKEHNLYYKMGFDFVGEEMELFIIK